MLTGATKLCYVMWPEPDADGKCTTLTVLNYFIIMVHFHLIEFFTIYLRDSKTQNIKAQKQDNIVKVLWFENNQEQSCSEQSTWFTQPVLLTLGFLTAQKHACCFTPALVGHQAPSLTTTSSSTSHITFPIYRHSTQIWRQSSTLSTFVRCRGNASCLRTRMCN